MVQEEKQRSLSSLTSDSTTFNVSASSSRQSSTSYRGKYERPMCGIPGHTMHMCYKFHGYPPGFKFKLRIPFNNSNRPVINQVGIGSEHAEDTSS